MKTFCSLSQFAAIAALVGFSSTFAVAATTTGSATVTAVRGSGMIGDQQAKVNAVVRPGTTITTGAESTIDLNLKENGPYVRVQPDSKLSIDDLTVRLATYQRIADLASPEAVAEMQAELGDRFLDAIRVHLAAATVF